MVMNGHQEAVPAGIDVVAMPAVVGYAASMQVSAAVLAAFACGTATVVADFTGTQFCDLAGIRAMLFAQRLADANHISLRLAAPEAAAWVFGVADLVLPVFSTLSEALTARPFPAPWAGR